MVAARKNYLLFGCLKNGHRFTLPIDYIANRCGYVLTFPQPTRTPVSCPPFAVGLIYIELIQTTAGVALETVHDLFRPRFGSDNHMNMTGPDVGGQQTPTANRTDFL